MGSRQGRLPEIDRNRCTGCGRCVAACDLHLLSLEPVRREKFSVLGDADACTGCGACAVSCPFDAIFMKRRAAQSNCWRVIHPFVRQHTDCTHMRDYRVRIRNLALPEGAS